MIRQMKKTSVKQLLFIAIGLIIFSCSNDDEKINSESNKIYLSPIEYDIIKESINDRLRFLNDDKSSYLPTDQDITMYFEYSGKMKEYMKYGTMNVRAYDSSVIVRKVDDTTFIFRVNKPYDDGVISMYFEPILHSPYYFSYIMHGKTYVLEPGEIIPVFMRSYLTKTIK